VAADNATRVVRRCTVAARLKALYGSVSNLDAFTGMMAEKHVTGSELGELQLATWRDQFGAARDGDRFFYQNDPLQSFIRNNFGIDSRKTLAQVIAANTDVAAASLPANVFRLPGAPNVSVGAVTGASTSAETTDTSAASQPDSFSRAGAAIFPDTATATTATPTTRRDNRNPTSPTQLNPQSAAVGGFPSARQLQRRRRRRCTATTG